MIFVREKNQKRKKTVLPIFLGKFEVMWKNGKYKSCRSFYYLQLFYL